MQSAPLQSLSGMRVLITRPKGGSESLSEKLRSLGAETVELPTIEIIAPRSTEALDHSIRNLSNYDWVIFTSVNGVRFFLERMRHLRVTSDLLQRVKIAAIGSATAASLEKSARRPDFVPEEFLSEKIVYGLGDVKGKRILLPRADIASRTLPRNLIGEGAIVEEVVAYETVIPKDLSLDRLQSILERGVNLVTFTSPSTVRNLANVTSSIGLGALIKGIKVACIGPVTAEAARGLGVHVDIVASNHSIDDLVEAIVNEIRSV